MNQCGIFGSFDVSAQLFRHHAGEVRHALAKNGGNPKASDREAKPEQMTITIQTA